MTPAESLAAVTRHLDRAMLVPIEKLVDSMGMAKLLDLLQEIAEGKAEHVAVNWGDKPLSATWDLVALAIGEAKTAAEALP